MDKLYYGDILLFDFSTVIKSESIVGIDFVTDDPGSVSDNVIHLILPLETSGSTLYLRYNDYLYEIGTKVTEIPTAQSNT